MADVRRQLQKAHKLIQAKRKSEARDVLVEILQEDETVIDAYWLWSLAAESADEAVEALEEVLRLDPQHSRAKKRIVQIKARQKNQQSRTGTVFSDTSDVPRPRRKKNKDAQIISLMIGVVFIILIGAIVLLILTQIQIGPCPAQSWLDDYREITAGLDVQLGRLKSAANIGNAEVMDEIIGVLEEYKSKIKKLYGAPCVRKTGDKARSYIDAVIAYAKAINEGARDKVIEDAIEKMNKKGNELNEQLRELERKANSASE